MSAKKPFLSEKEYRKIHALLAQARKELNKKFIEAMTADASMPEYGEVLLRYFNRFRNDAEKIVAIMDIFFLGLNLRKIGDDGEAAEKAEEERIMKILATIKKQGGLPS